MWPFSRPTPKTDEPPSLKQRVQALELAIDDLQHELNRLSEQHLKLAGRYYRRFGRGSDDGDAPPAAPTTKDELRRLAGIVPGRPAPHR